MKKEELLIAYIQLARKLGKFPTLKEVVRFITSERQIYNAFPKGFSTLKDAAIKADPTLETHIMPAELTGMDLEQYRLGLEEKTINKKNKTTINQVSAIDYVAKFADHVFAGQVEPHNPPEKKASIQRAINLTLSDLHFGADIFSKETGYLNYGRVEEARRFAEVIKQTIEYKPHYRKETELHVNLLGDIIQHKLHDSQDAAPVSEQVCRAIHLLIQGFAQLAENFSRVHVHCATGNHGRDLNRHKERATSGKWDSVETVIYYSVKSALSNYKNMTFDIPKTPFVIYEVFGHKIFATHGDNVLKPGNPGTALRIGNLENQINRINASLKDKEEIKVAIVGHTHCASISNLNTGCIMVMNGALPPVDQYTVSIGFLENRASQTIFEVTPEHALGDIRFIRVGKEQDKNEALEKIIKPWKSF